MQSEAEQKKNNVNIDLLPNAGKTMFRRLTTLKVSKMRGFSALVQTKALVNGNWIDSCSRQTFEVKNPANGKVIGLVPDMTVEDAQRAINAAKQAFESKEWRSLTAKDRSNMLKVYNWHTDASRLKH